MFASLSLFTAASVDAVAQSPVGPADIDRIRSLQERFVAPQPVDETVISKPKEQPVDAPEGADEILITIKSIKFNGVTAFSEDEIKPIYEEYIGKETTLDTLWLVAQQLTKKYHAHGYSLSRAYIPVQEVEDGNVSINVVEGFISTVGFSNNAKPNNPTKQIINRIISQKPLNIPSLEDSLLKLNDLPGYSYRAIIEAGEGLEDDGSLHLTLIPVEKRSAGLITIDNYGSRYLGPHEVTGIYSTSLLDIADITVSGLFTPHDDELRYGGLSNKFYLFPELSIETYGSYTTATPGYLLKISEIDSQSTTLGIAAKYQLTRQREYNMALRLSLVGRNTNTDLINTALVRDRVRVAGIEFLADFSDPLGGYSDLNFKISRGLDIFGASQEGELNLSRGKATPHFTKVQIDAERIQALDNDWSFATKLSSQWSDNPLFSSEQFGYGGISLGRAYDASEITGDSGLSFSFELRYDGLGQFSWVALTPYGFYDIGKIWNKDSTQVHHQSASSAGFGLRAVTNINVSADIGLAYPLTHDISAPLYGADKDDPRLLFSINYNF